MDYLNADSEMRSNFTDIKSKKSFLKYGEMQWKS